MTGICTFFTKGGAVLAAALFVSPAAAQDEPLMLQPTSDWHLDYADDSCRLLRQFGEGDNQSMFYIERYEPGDQFFLVIAGKPFEGRASAKDAARFGPGGYEFVGYLPEGKIGKYETALLLSGLQLLPSEAPIVKTKVRQTAAQVPDDTDIFGQEASAADESRISWFEIDRRSGQSVRVNLGSMGEPLAAMRRCTDELLTHWGIDLEAHRKLTRAASPRGNPGTWVTDNDYPRDLIRKGEQGIVQFRLSIGANGRPTQCHIQRSTRPIGFDTAVCDALMRRARFEPALDANGKPIASYWRNAVRFQMPN